MFGQARHPADGGSLSLGKISGQVDALAAARLAGCGPGRAQGVRSLRAPKPSDMLRAVVSHLTTNQPIFTLEPPSGAAIFLPVAAPPMRESHPRRAGGL
jgi:hypothetical protein